MAVGEIMHVKLHNDLPRASENLWQLGAFSKGELYLSEHLPGTSSHLSPHNSDYMGLYIVCLQSDSPPSSCMRPSRMIYLKCCFVVISLVPRGGGTFCAHHTTRHPYTSLQCHFNRNHIHRVCMCLAVTFHLHLFGRKTGIFLILLR